MNLHDSISVLTARIILGAAGASALVTDDICETASMRGPHSPVEINGESDLSDFISSEGWSGSGSESDPYLVHNISISGSSGGVGISTANTSSHLILEEIDVSFSAGPGVGFLMDNSSNEIGRPSCRESARVGV